MAESELSSDHETRITRVEAELRTVVRSVGDLVMAVKERDERAERQHADTQKTIRNLAEQRGVSLPQILVGLGACVGGMGTIAVVFGLVVGGILYLAANQSREASRDMAAQLRPSIVALNEKAVANDASLEGREMFMEATTRAIESLDRVVEANRLVDNGQDVAISSLEQSRDEATRRFLENEDDIEKLGSAVSDIRESRFTGDDGSDLREELVELRGEVSRLSALVEVLMGRVE